MDQDRRKILLVITKSNWGGAQKYVFDLATGLPKDRFEVAVALGGTGLPGAPVGQLAERLQQAGVRTIFVKAFARDIRLFGDLRAFFSLLYIFLKEKPNIVHLNSSKAGGIGALAARIARVPRIVFTAHGWAFTEDRGTLARTIIYRISKITAKLCHAIVCVSQFDARQAQRMGKGIAQKTHVIHNGIGPIAFASRQEARATLVPSDVAARHADHLWVITNAELHPNKNLFTAIDAVAAYNESHLPKIFYTIVSDGQERAKIDAMLTRRKLREEVFLAGFVPEAARYSKAADIFFLPSKKEGLPYVILEAGLAELPVVASNVGGIPEIIEDDVCGILRAPGDTQGFTDAFAQLACDEKLRETLGVELLSRVKNHFSLEEMIRETMALYEQNTTIDTMNGRLYNTPS